MGPLAESGLVLQTMPAATAKFSSAWFQSVTFQQACSIQFPSPVPKSGVLYWYFSYAELDAVCTAILPEDHGFSHAQLRPIIEGIPAAFREGKRSVVVAYTIPGIATRFERTFTFQKVNSRI
jgi:hypothetical protein